MFQIFYFQEKLKRVLKVCIWPTVLLRNWSFLDNFLKWPKNGRKFYKIIKDTKNSGNMSGQLKNRYIFTFKDLERYLNL